jgi:phosphatidylglycerophosphatase A
MAVSDRPGAKARPRFLPTLIATGLFAGYIPWASGTFGSLVGLLIALIPGAAHPLTLCILIGIFLPVGIVTSGIVAAAEGHRLTPSAAAAKTILQPGPHAVPDPSIVVIDEIVGMWISLLFVPAQLPVMLIAFVAFRLFDIIKPPPARNMEKIPHGWGIMLDDVVAGVYANLLTQILLVAIPALA